MRKLRLITSLLLMIALPVSGFAGLYRCHHHTGERDQTTAAHQHHANIPLAGTSHETQSSAQHADCDHATTQSGDKPDRPGCQCVGLCALACAGASAMPATLQAVFDYVPVSSSPVTNAQFSAPDVRLETPYRPPIPA